MSKKVIAIAGIVLIVIFAGVILATTSSSSQADLSTLKAASEFKVFKTQACGCCALYSSYVQGKGARTSVVQMEDLTELKMQLGIPKQLQSCHTSTVGGYFVEGHVPLEAVEKLLKEKPSTVKGIAVPGMPMGSPGMPGAKEGPIVVTAVNADGSSFEFMQI